MDNGISEFEKAILIVETIRNEIALGTKHYHKSQMRQLNSEKEILEAMLTNDLIIEFVSDRDTSTFVN